MTTPGKGAPKSAHIFTFTFLLILGGCFPHSCRRSESTELLPADSLSRDIARSIPADTLRLLWTSGGTDQHPLEFPRTVRAGTDGSVYVSDVQRHSLFVLTENGSGREIPLPHIEVPYLAGMSADTVSIFNPATLTMYRLLDDELVDSMKIEDTERNENSLVYGAADDLIHYKRVGQDQNGIVLSYAGDGTPVDSTRLTGSYWRHAGLLKTWGDTLVSLSGFRPVVDLIVPADGPPFQASAARTEQPATRLPAAAADSLSLVGFDSPMLARSLSFIRGDIHEAPLLSASAAASGNLLFVLNMRPGWLQVDVFDREGHLQHRLVQSTRGYESAFFPQDIDVRRTPEGYEIAVIISEPQPELQVFRWALDKAGNRLHQ